MGTCEYCDAPAVDEIRQDNGPWVTVCREHLNGVGPTLHDVAVVLGLPVQGDDGNGVPLVEVTRDEYITVAVVTECDDPDNAFTIGVYGKREWVEMGEPDEMYHVRGLVEVLDIVGRWS